MSLLVVDNIHEAVTCAGVAKKKGRFLEKSDLSLLHNAYIVIESDTIIHIGLVQDDKHAYFLKRASQTLDAKLKTVFPGFIDCHTHPVFGSNRSIEFEQKIEGKTYQEIAKEGGGINYTVKHTRNASLVDLSEQAFQTFEHFLSLGVTTCEAKSGYGLDVESEIKLLTAIHQASLQTSLEVIPTFLGAHAIPPEYKQNPQAYVQLICNEMLPRVVKEDLSTQCDIFVEENYFTIDQAKEIFLMAQSLGMKVKIHADEFSNTHGALLGAEFKALSADHLEMTDIDGIKSMAKNDVTAVLLPATSYYSNLDYTNPKPFIEHGVPIAIATDFNPGSCVCDNLIWVMNMAALKMRLAPFQVIAGTTYNAAKALGIEHLVGSIEVGKQADLAIFNIPNYAYLMYHIGRNFLVHTIKKGIIR